MKKFLNALLALLLAVSASSPAFAAASTTVMSRVNFENQERTNNKLFKDTMIDNLLIKFPFYMLANPSDPNIYGNYGKFVLAPALGQDTTYTIPDPGSSAATFVLAGGAGAPAVVNHITVNLTVANVTGMYGTPVSVIAAATGKTIVIEDVFMTYTEGGGAFAAGGTVQLQYHGGSAATGVVAATAITAASGSTYSVLKPLSVIGLQATGIDITNNTQAFTQSAATGAPVLDIYYRLQ